MMPGQIVLSRIEKGPGEFEAWSGEIGVSDEHGAEARDGGLPVTTLHGDHALQEVQLVDVSFTRLNDLRAGTRHRPPCPRPRRYGRLRSGFRWESSDDDGS